MSLVTLRDIGKIYVSEGNVSVGIRGVNLSFDRGEFVAITGKSGSGKSTLLNVISGMDTYEEGELLIDGAPTSHYLQPDWEGYRQKYVSFIFQDYNIIESFTVLQNVELALMHIADPRARRARALELIRRVGLSSHAKQKGSRLSGGQKQRTVIARALAKDSPIILADEPTGNLDAATSREIISLLREVSRDKLLIVVTHNFDEVAAYATRHVRIYDGAVESDDAISPPTPVEPLPPVTAQARPRCHDIRAGMTLGRTVFFSRPRLSVFLSLLLLVGTLGVFAVTALSGSGITVFDKHYMFTPIEGRVIVASPSGKVLAEPELSALAEEYGADSYLCCDYLLDAADQTSPVYIPALKRTLVADCIYGESYGRHIVGSYPTEKDEVLLYLPISEQPSFGKETLKITELMIGALSLRVSGVAYYYNNSRTPKLLFTEDGFRTATNYLYLTEGSLNFKLSLTKGDLHNYFLYSGIVPSFDIPSGKIYIDDPLYRRLSPEDGTSEASISVQYRRYNYYSNEESALYSYAREYGNADIVHIPPTLLTDTSFVYNQTAVYMSTDLIDEISIALQGEAYRQASLFFGDDREAKAAARRLCDRGYVAVASNETYSPDPFTLILETVVSIVMLLLWAVAILFLAFFLTLCTSRTVGAFRGDMAIMRSMGIPVRVIRIGMYVRMLIALLPAYLLTALTVFLIFRIPVTNAYFVWLYPYQYALIALGMLALTLLVTRGQVRRLFGESVKGALRGGERE